MDSYIICNELAYSSSILHILAQVIWFLEQITQPAN